MSENELLLAISDKLNSMESKMDSMESKLADMRLHIENVTDRNISLIAESHSNLVRKLDENIQITDQTLAYQVKVNFLAGEIEKLKSEIENLKSKIA